MTLVTHPETERDDTMSELKDVTGPLTERQRTILKLASEGLSYKLIAPKLGVSRVIIATEMQRVMRKLGVPNSSAACALYGQWRDMVATAAELRAGRIVNPFGEAEEHMNGVLSDYAERIENRAARLIP